MSNDRFQKSATLWMIIVFVSKILQNTVDEVDLLLQIIHIKLNKNE